MEQKALVALDIKEMTANGLQLIVRLPVAEPTFDEKEWQEGISEMTERIANNVKFWLSTDEIGFNIPKMQDKTIVVQGIFEMLERD